MFACVEPVREKGLLVHLSGDTTIKCTELKVLLCCSLLQTNVLSQNHSWGTRRYLAKNLPLRSLAGNVCTLFLKNALRDAALVNLHSLKLTKNFVRGCRCLVWEAIVRYNVHHSMSHSKSKANPQMMLESQKWVVQERKALTMTKRA